MKTSSVFFIIGRRKVLPYSKNLWTASSDLANEGKVMIKQEYTLCEVEDSQADQDFVEFAAVKPVAHLVRKPGTRRSPGRSLSTSSTVLKTCDVRRSSPDYQLRSRHRGQSLSNEAKPLEFARLFRGTPHPLAKPLLNWPLIPQRLSNTCPFILKMIELGFEVCIFKTRAHQGVKSVLPRCETYCVSFSGSDRVSKGLVTPPFCPENRIIRIYLKSFKPRMLQAIAAISCRLETYCASLLSFGGAL